MVLVRPLVTKEPDLQLREQHAAADGAAAVGDRGHFGVLHLALVAATAQLHDGLVDEAEAVEATGGKLTAVGVEREFAVEVEARAALDEGTRLALAAEAE